MSLTLDPRKWSTMTQAIVLLFAACAPAMYFMVDALNREEAQAIIDARQREAARQRTVPRPRDVTMTMRFPEVGAGELWCSAGRVICRCEP